MYYKTQFRYFTKFLLSNNIYEEFEKEYLVSNYNKVPFKRYISWKNENLLILLAFEFNKTEKGFDYWMKINNKWLEELVNIKIKVNNHYKNRGK